MRTWGSINIGHGIRIGRSYGPEDVGPPRLPSWRKWELSHGLIKAAEARGEKMPKDEAAYIVDKALAVGLLDAKGDFINVEGSRDAGIDAIVNVTAAWWQPMTRAEAAARFDKVARRQWWKWFS